MRQNLYDTEFYEEQKKGSLMSAQVVVPALLGLLKNMPVRSVCDFGCGVGTWLSVMAEQGVETIKGFDGDYVPRDQLMIADRDFITADLSRPQPRPERFDIAMSLEVAEHIPEESADIFVANLCSLAGVVVFSACPPTPLHGTGHINEQTQSYWAQKFLERGFLPSTALRDLIWGDPRVEWFYRQNIVLYIHKDIFGSLHLRSLAPQEFPLLDVRHPHFAQLVIKESVRMHSSWDLLKITLARLIK